MLFMESIESSDYYLLVLNGRTYNYPDFRQFPLASICREIYYKKYKKLVMNLIDRPQLYSKYDVCIFSGCQRYQSRCQSRCQSRYPVLNRNLLPPAYNELPPVYDELPSVYNDLSLVHDYLLPDYSDLPPAYNI